MKNILRASAAVVALTLSAIPVSHSALAVTYGPPSLAPAGGGNCSPAVVNISSTVKLGAMQDQDEESSPDDQGPGPAGRAAENARHAAFPTRLPIRGFFQRIHE